MYTRAEMLIMLATGITVGALLTRYKMAQDYNALAKKYNFRIDREKIMKRIFDEVMPQLPDDYDLTEQTMIDIKSWTMFADNQL